MSESSAAVGWRDRVAVAFPERSVRHKLGVLAYTLLYTLVVLLAFYFPDVAPGATLIFPLTGLYVLGLMLVLDDVHDTVALALLLATTFLLMLIVIDPFEPGLYSWDAQKTLNDLAAFPEFDSLAEFIRTTENRVLLFPFVLVVQSMTGLPAATVGKYVPLLNAALPLFYFYLLSRLTTAKTAFIAAFGVASLRTLSLFETAFAPESIAVFLLFVSLAVTTLPLNNRLRAALATVLGIEISLAHHLTSVLAAFVLALWFFAYPASTLGDTRPIQWLRLSRFLPASGAESLRVRLTNVGTGVTERIDDRQPRSPSIWVLGIAATAVGVSTVVIFATTQANLVTGDVGFIVEVLTFNDTAESAPGSVGGGGGQASTPTQAALASYGSITVLALLAAVVAWAIFSAYDNNRWETAWIVNSGVLSVMYLVVLTFGDLVGLHGHRFLTFLVPFLLGAAVYVLANAEELPIFARFDGHTVAAVIVACFVLTQTAAIPPNVLYTDPAQSVTAGTGHKPEHATSAAQWTERYDAPAIVGWDPSLWAQFVSHGFVGNEEFDGTCGDGTVLVWRDATRNEGINPSELTGAGDVIYSNDDSGTGGVDRYDATRLVYCTGEAPAAADVLN